MSQVGGNNIGEATVRITADTSGLKQGLTEAEAQVSQAQTNIASTGDKIAPNMAIAAGAIAATAATAFRLGVELEAVAEKFLGLKDNASDVFEAIDSASQTPVQRARARLKELTKEILDDSIPASAERVWAKVWDALYPAANVEAGMVARAAKAREQAQALVDTAESQANKESIRRKIAEQETATLEGAERIERKRLEAIERVRREFSKEDTSGLVDAINKRYDEDLRRFQELEAKKKAADEESAQRHMDEIEARKRAYNDLIQHQKMKDREAAAALADAMSKALSGAFSEMTRSFELNKLVTTMSALNANMEKLTRQRSAQG